MDPAVIYEDDAIIVVNKPNGWSVHGDGRHTYPTVVEWLLMHYKDIAHVGESQTLSNGVVIERPGIVHRLDRETSGVMVVARTQKAFESLKRQFHDHGVRKVYRAFVYGGIKDDRGIIEKPIGSGRNGLAPRSARAPHGVMREAITAYRVIERVPEASHVEVFPKTGRTHQIRVHFASVGHPVVCDVLYGGVRLPLLGFTRLALHALSLSFKHPTSKKEVSFDAPLPTDFLNAEISLHRH